MANAGPNTNGSQFFITTGQSSTSSRLFFVRFQTFLLSFDRIFHSFCVENLSLFFFLEFFVFLDILQF